MIIWCERCGVKKMKHRAKCDFCTKTHPLCEECYQEGKVEGTIKDIQQKGILARIFG